MKTSDNFLKDFPSNESANHAIESFRESIKSHGAAMDRRAENYYNCIDDYSYGGICDQASSQAISGYTHAIQCLTEQINLGKPFIADFDCDVLCNLDGKIVSEKIVNGRFGPCWIIKDGNNVAFVGTSKKQATYNKKGYKVMNRIYTVEYYYTTNHTFKHGLVTRGRILSEKLIDAPKTDLWVSDRMNSIAYFALHSSN